MNVSQLPIKHTYTYLNSEYVIKGNELERVIYFSGKDSILMIAKVMINHRYKLIAPQRQQHLMMHSSSSHTRNVSSLSLFLFSQGTHIKKKKKGERVIEGR